MKNTICFLFCLLTSFCWAQEKDYSEFEIILEFKTNNYENKMELFLSDSSLLKLNETFELESLQLIGNKKLKNTLLAKFRHEINIQEAVQRYFQTGLFEYVEPNFKGQGHGMAQITPNDAFYSRQWAHFNNGTFSLSTATADADIDTDLAWNITQGDPNLIVAILDSGIKLDHPEFSGRVVTGWDFVNNDNNPTDDHGHGTNVAGIALAKGNNSVGYAGVNWNSKIMPLKILDNNNSGFYTWWADALYYAVDNGAKVINMSVGGNSASTLLQNAIDYAYNNNVAVVVSTGNQNSVIQYPAKYTNAIAVGSTNSNDTRSVPFFWSSSSGSNFGPELDFVAPGNYIYGLNYSSNTNYGTYWGGTSQAAPHVAGLISLMLSVNPSLSVSQIRSILEQTAEDQVGDAFDLPGWDQYYGHGRINAFAALSSITVSNTPKIEATTNIKIYPNPVHTGNSFFIEGIVLDGVYRISILSLDGRLIEEFSKKATNSLMEVQTPQLIPGIYFVKIQDKETGKTHVEKLVKK